MGSEGGEGHTRADTNPDAPKYHSLKSCGFYLYALLFDENFPHFKNFVNDFR